MRLRQSDDYATGALQLLDEPAARPGIAGTAYDTAWLASVPAGADRRSPRFPASLQWLAKQQWPDGSWGGSVRYEHDRVLSTLAALVPLATYSRGASDRRLVEDGTRFLWEHGHRLESEPVELVAFELLLPALVRRAERAGIAVPPRLLDIYGPQRAEKLRLIPAEAWYSPRVTTVHSLELLGDQADLAGLRAVVGENGSIGNSPATTAFFLGQTSDPHDPQALAALAYLESCQAHAGSPTAPVVHPCETFELLWSAYHYHLVGVPAALLLTAAEREHLRTALRAGGVSLSSTFPIADADDTAVALILLSDLGETVDPTVLEKFALPDGHFASFPYERHASVGVNLHVLHALLRVPGYPDQERAVDRLLEYLVHQQIERQYWLDKWHISPYYATAHALRVLAELLPHQAARVDPVIERARDWLRQSQNPDGSWGFYGQPTAEETAYGALALSAGNPERLNEPDRQRCASAVRFLESTRDGNQPDAHPAFPPLWIDKCLYTPTLIVQSAIEAARGAIGQLSRAPKGERWVDPVAYRPVAPALAATPA